MENLYQLLYTSFVTPNINDADVREIVWQARKTNAALRITGLLIFDGLRICQYLEGPSDTLHPLMERIRHDPRHLEFDVKERRYVNDRRRFEALPMGFAMANSPDDLDRFHKFKIAPGSSAITLLDDVLPTLHIERASPL